MKILVLCPIQREEIQELLQTLDIKLYKNFEFYTNMLEADMINYIHKTNDFTLNYINCSLNAHYNIDDDRNVIFVGLLNRNEEVDLIIAAKGQITLAQELALNFYDENGNAATPFYTTKEAHRSIVDYSEVANVIYDSFVK